MVKVVICKSDSCSVDGREIDVDAGGEDEAISALSAGLGLNVVGLTCFDEDFEEWVPWDDMDEILDGLKVQLVVAPQPAAAGAGGDEQDELSAILA